MCAFYCPPLGNILILTIKSKFIKVHIQANHVYFGHKITRVGYGFIHIFILKLLMHYAAEMGYIEPSHGG